MLRTLRLKLNGAVLLYRGGGSSTATAGSTTFAFHTTRNRLANWRNQARCSGGLLIKSPHRISYFQKHSPLGHAAVLQRRAQCLVQTCNREPYLP